ncbi:hypothetical protein HGRIS_001643 [Hohenbuehelia grisea]|uniref:Uncharacterized protein n=1 Tax=Hohenbuehelia grisea TaxID=104357 RepID=A0ABR3JI54_9AGAR
MPRATSIFVPPSDIRITAPHRQLAERKFLVFLAPYYTRAAKEKSMSEFITLAYDLWMAHFPLMGDLSDNDQVQWTIANPGFKRFKKLLIWYAGMPRKPAVKGHHWLFDLLTEDGMLDLSV